MIVITIVSFIVNRKGVLISNIITIKINNWKKYNDHNQNKLKRPWWFKLSNHIHIDQDLREFSVEQKWIWICILCEASLQRKDTILLDINFHPVLWCIDRVTLYDTVHNLESKHMVTIVSGGSSPAQIRIRKEKKNTYVETDVSQPTKVGVSTKDFVDAYNANCLNLAKVLAISKPRTARIKQAIKDLEQLNLSLEDFSKLIKFISRDDFYSGKNKTGWRADLDFIIQPGKLIQLFEKHKNQTYKAPRELTLEDLRK